MIMPSSSPSRILMTADTVGGVWTYALELIRALGESGVEVTLAAMGGTASPEQRTDAQSIPNLELHESEYRLPWMDRPWDDVQRAGDWLLELADRAQAELVHLNEPVFGSLNWRMPVASVAHSCVLSWWQSVQGVPAPREWDRYRDEMREGLHGADMVVAPSRWMLSSLGQHYGISIGQVIPNGRDPATLVPGNKSPLVFAAGRLWDPAKNLLALEAIAKDLPWPVYVAGDPRQPGRPESISAKHLCLLGSLPAKSVASWFRLASIYAFPARYEPFGLSVLEAALAGCALVLGDIPTLRELWDGCAVFVSPDDPETLRLAVQGLIGDPELRHSLAMRSRRRALALSPRRMATAYLDLYRTLLPGRSRLAAESACAS
jgi:glycosyltransferase involved in cell wall biosynthesis